MTIKAKYYLDITPDVCPLTFVKTKLMLEKMPPGEIATVRIKGAEPLENVPRSVRAHGHEVIGLVPENPAETGPKAAHILTIKRL